jgi:hypothetical protein
MPAYVGNGVTTQFNYTFAIISINDVKVYKTGLDGNTVKLTDGYLVSPNDINDLSSGGHVIYPYPIGDNLASGERISLVREVDMTQDDHWTNGGPYDAETFEMALDKVTMGLQQCEETCSRVLKANITESTGDYTLPAAIANKVIGWDPTGTILDNFDNPGVAQIAAEEAAAEALASQTAAAISAAAAATYAFYSVTAAISGDVTKQITINDPNIADTSKIMVSVRRPDQPHEWEDSCYYYVANVIYQTNGSFLVNVTCFDEDGGSPILDPPNETITLCYSYQN